MLSTAKGRGDGSALFAAVARGPPRIRLTATQFQDPKSSGTMVTNAGLNGSPATLARNGARGCVAADLE
jgi:hypothetical protein